MKKTCKKCKAKFIPEKGLVNYCSLKCRNSREQTEEIRKKKSIAAKNSEKVLKANRDPKRALTRHKIRGERSNKWKESRCMRCENPIRHRKSNPRKYHSECWKKSSGGFRKNSTRVHRNIYKGYQMDSGAELVFAKLLTNNKIRWVKNTTTYFEYERVDGKVGKYYPDFYLTDYNKWIEIKGKFYASLDENLERKLQAVESIQIIYAKDLHNINIQGLVV